MSDRYGSSSRRRSASPGAPPRSRYRDDPHDDDRRERRGGRGYNDDDYDDGKRAGSRRSYGDDRRSERRRDDGRPPPRGSNSRSPPPPSSSRGGRYNERERDSGRRRSRSPRSAPREAAAGDGGWGRRERNGEGDGGLPDQDALVPGGASGSRGGGGGKDVAPPPKPVEPDFKPSGALAAETNTLNGVVLKYAEPPEARKPVRNWRLYVFKGKEQVELFHVHRQSAYLIGRDRIVADIPVDHPSASKQHAVLQFRQVVERNEFGDTKGSTKPFLIDLDSANGTVVNDEAVPASRFYELRSGDVLKFAFSTREYVLLVES
ncbi:hypothetical protein JCM8202_002893 [Rhodotorula sphaerocarpa]